MVCGLQMVLISGPGTDEVSLSLLSLVLISRMTLYSFCLIFLAEQLIELFFEVLLEGLKIRRQRFKKVVVVISDHDEEAIFSADMRKNSSSITIFIRPKFNAILPFFRNKVQIKNPIQSFIHKNNPFQHMMKKVKCQDKSFLSAISSSTLCTPLGAACCVSVKIEIIWTNFDRN
jgi:hypothetical protein